MSRIAAFFDIDGTLVDVNSALLWARLERQEGRLGRLRMGWVLVWLGLYRLALVDVERAYARAVRHYRGVSSADLERRIREWFHSDILHRLRPGARRALDEHRQRGHSLVLLTSVSDYQAAMAADAWGLDDWLANHFPFGPDGRLTGELARPICYGRGKVAHAERWAREHDVDLERCWFYTDSYTDVPMLERVGEPRVVAPDPRLRRLARRRGWAEVRW